MIISIAIDKGFHQIQHLFMIKALKKLGLKYTLFNIIKAMYDKIVANIVLNETLYENETISPKIRDKTRMCTHSSYSIVCLNF
jgi:hypothetical protein